MSPLGDKKTEKPDLEGQSADLSRLLKHIGSQKTPPVHLWEPDYCGEIDIRIARDGTWYYMGSPIGRPELVQLFSSVLRQDADGTTYLVTPVEKLKIKVEDAPLLVVAMQVFENGSDQKIVFETLTGDKVLVGSEHPIRMDENKKGEPSPYVHIRANLEALINRPIFYDLVELAEPSKMNPDFIGVWSNGRFFELGNVTPS